MILILIGNMKKILYFSGIIPLLFACTAELETPSDTKEGPASVLYASIDDGATTRVYLDDDYRVLWNSDDRISVFKKDTYNQEYKFDGGDGANAGTFSIVEDGKLKASNDIDYLYAVYPYSASTTISNDGVLSVTLPAEQEYASVSFGRGANTMVAVTEDDNMKFKNACGYLMFKLYGDGVNVKTVSLRGNNHEKIAGEATIAMSLGGTPSVTMLDSATEEITLTCESAVTIGATSGNYTEFWFAIPPITFAKGFTLTVSDANGGYYSKSTYSEVEIVRSHAQKMAPIQVIYDSYLVYRANPTSYNSRYYESYFPGFSNGYTVEMKFKMEEGENAQSFGYPIGSDNTLRDDYNYLQLTYDNRLYWRTYDEDEPSLSLDLGRYGISSTDQIILRFSSNDQTLSINGIKFDCSMERMTFQNLFAEYEYENDDGIYSNYIGVPDGSKLFYVKAYSSSGDLVYDGYPSESYNSASGKTEKCWYSNKSGVVTYTFANDSKNQGGFDGYIR